MKRQLTAQRLVLTLAMVACSIFIFSFRQNETTEQKTFRDEPGRRDDDTTKGHKHTGSSNEFRFRDLDQHLKMLDDQMATLNAQIGKLDLNKIEKDINAASAIDGKKIAADIQASFAKVDWKKMQDELKNSTMKLQAVNLEKMQENLAKVKENLEKEHFDMKLNGEKMRKEIEESMKNARLSMEKAKVEIKGMKDLTEALDHDGLINKNKPLKIQLKDGELYLNDLKQPKEVSDKYRKYYKKPNFTIQVDGDEKDRI